MAKHPRKRHKKAKRRPVYAWPLAPEAFRQAVLRVTAAAGTPQPLLHERVTPPITLRGGRNEELAIPLTDTPVILKCCSNFVIKPIRSNKMRGCRAKIATKPENTGLHKAILIL